MHIGIEAHGFWGDVEGQGAYIANLIRALGRLDRTNRYTLLFNSFTRTPARRAAVARQLPPNFQAVFLPLPNVYHPSVLFMKERVVWPAVTRRLGIDVFHATSYRGIFAEGMRTVLSVHDFAYHHCPETFRPESLGYYRRLPQDAARAALVMTLSDSSRQDAVRVLGLPPEKVRTVYAGVDLDRFNTRSSLPEVEATRSRYGIRSPSILFLGNLNPKKNVGTLIAALGRLRAQGQDRYQLVLAGKATAHQDSIRRAIAAWSLGAQAVCTGFVPDEELPLLYRAVDLFAFPSLFEGFGLPVLEAMACGTPVVASNATSIPEVAGEAAVLVDPRDAAALAAAIRRVFEDAALRASLVEQGAAQARRFSWEQAAARVLDVYRAAGNGAR
ncbi:MAG: glycosyltransferase family 4 protein [Candidatus Omnitrophica bacterium]|nr:glycosyltransferase family 4 protein [Candidatus Omnitrophota bacterium]